MAFMYQLIFWLPMDKDAVMLIKGYYKCAMEGEDFIIVRRNGGDVLICAVDSQTSQFRNT